MQTVIADELIALDLLKRLRRVKPAKYVEVVEGLSRVVVAFEDEHKALKQISPPDQN